MSISKKMLISFSCMILFILGISTFSFIQIKNTNSTYTSLINSELQGVYATTELQHQLDVQKTLIQKYQLNQDEQTIKQIKKQLTIVDEQLILLNSIAKSADIKQYITTLNSQHEQSKQYIHNLIGLNKSEILENKIKSYIISIEALLNDSDQTVNDVITIVKERFHNASDQKNKEVRNMIIILSSISLISILLAFFFIYNFHKDVTTPLKVLVNYSKKIANGDLSEPNLQIKSKDEIGQLTASYNKMKESLNSLISVCQTNTFELSAISTQLSSSTSVVTDAASNMTSNIEQITIRTNATALHADETLIAMEQSASGVQHLYEQTNSIYHASEQTTTLTNEGANKLITAKQQMSIIFDAAQTTSHLIENLSQQSKQIYQLTNVITDIADQTNLLSLNANIEAARAGEHGKGFAVVASEVKKLAEQSRTSADMIVELTNGITIGTSNVVQAMSNGLSSVEQGVSTIEETIGIFDLITKQFKEITDRLNNISSVTEQISSSTNQVTSVANELTHNLHGLSNGAENVTQQVEEQLASIQEIHAISENLDEKSQELANVISHFQLAAK